jgi:hypothetical protein
MHRSSDMSAGNPPIRPGRARQFVGLGSFMITLCFTDLPHGCPVIDDLLVGLMLALAVLAQ